MKNYKQGSAVRIFWIDSSTTPGWQRGIEGILGVGHIVTLGYIVSTTEDEVIVTGSFEAGGAFLGCVSIPRVAIVSIETIKEWDR